MSISLFEHNETAYQNAVAMLENCKKAAIIHPTGTGKSFIGFKLCEDNPNKRICWLSPSEYIFKTQIENVKRVEPDFKIDNIIFLTYAKLALMSKPDIASIKPDYIILDEFHRCGASEWGKGVVQILNTYNEIPVLGLSATAIRYLDSRRNMADELFDGNIASEMTLGDAIVRGILNPPKYVLSVFSYQKNLEKYGERVKRAKNKAAKDAGEKYLELIKRALEKADNLDAVFDKHMTERTGKYIIFCANKEHMDEMIKKAGEWFGSVDKSPRIYSFYSEDAFANREFTEFKNDKDDSHLRLLYCIDALNEGIHVDDISGVILLRPTISPIIYKQQIGRALSTGGRKAVIFDIVLNIENLYSIDAVEKEMQIATTYYRSLGQSEIIVNEHFKVIDEVRDCLELFEKLNETLSASWECMFEEAQKYYAENGDLDVSKRYITEDGYTLGLWVNTQRRVYSGKANGILTAEQIRKLEAIGMCWDNKQDIAWQRYYTAAKAYYDEHGDLLVPVSDDNIHGVRLGRWIANIRIYKRSGIKTAYLTPERVQMLENIGMVWDVFDYVWERNYHAAVEYHREHGNLNVNNQYVTKDGIRLGVWVHSLRSARRSANPQKCPTPEQIARLDELGMNWESVYNISWEKSYAEACEYFKEHGHLNIPVAYSTKNGCNLGKWIRRQRNKAKLSKERVLKLEQIGMTWEVKDAWEEKYALLKQYYDEHGDIKIACDYVVDGVWLGKWLSEQKLKLSGKRNSKTPLTDEQISKLKALGVMPNRTYNDSLWDAHYNEAKNFYCKYGSIKNIPKDYLDSTGVYLDRWVITQRKKYKEGNLSKEQISRLTELGMA